MTRRPTPARLRAVRRQLQDRLGTERVSDDDETLERYGRDWSVAAAVRPDLVVRAESTADVSEVMRAAQDHEVPVTPRGLGSGKSGGAIPIYGGIVLALENLTGEPTISEEDMTVDVGAGTVLSDLWRAVEDRGLFYPPDPNSFDLCTIGGNIACNAGGPRALKYGVTRNYVLGLEIVLPGGEVFEVGKRTLKHVTGYDLAGLIVGSEGTLGVITKATLRLLPKPGAVETGLVTFSEVGEAARTLTKLLAEGHTPRVLELLDHHALDAVRRASPGSFPESAGALIIVETDGPTHDRAFADLERFAERCLEAGALDVQVAQSEADRRRIWGPRNILSESLRATAEAKMSEDIVVPRSRIPDFVAAADAISKRHGIRVATYGHAGDGNLHVNVLFDEADREAADAAVVDVMRTSVEMGGTLSGEHGLGITKRAFLPMEHSSTKIALQRSLKATLDPLDILNPGKIFPEVTLSP